MIWAPFSTSYLLERMKIWKLKKNIETLCKIFRILKSIMALIVWEVITWKALFWSILPGTPKASHPWQTYQDKSYTTPILITFYLIFNWDSASDPRIFIHFFLFLFSLAKANFLRCSVSKTLRRSKRRWSNFSNAQHR